MEISSIELQKKINNGEKIMVEFWAEWCGPCKMMKPIFEKVSTDNSSEVQMYTMDVDLNREIAISLGIRSVPTIKVFNKYFWDFACFVGLPQVGRPTGSGA